MKPFVRSLLLATVGIVATVSLVSAAPPTMQVEVLTEGGKLAFKGKTDAAGLFTTKELAPGSYVVQLNSTSSKGGPYAVVVSAGKKKVAAESVPAAKFAGGGVAMKLQVDKPMSVTGQVSLAGQTASASNQGTHPDGVAFMEKGHKVKYVNGKKFVWSQNELGSNLGGRWVDANSPQGRQIENFSNGDFQKLQQTNVSGGGGN